MNLRNNFCVERRYCLNPSECAMLPLICAEATTLFINVHHFVSPVLLSPISSITERYRLFHLVSLPSLLLYHLFHFVRWYHIITILPSTSFRFWVGHWIHPPRMVFTITPNFLAHERIFSIIIAGRDYRVSLPLDRAEIQLRHISNTLRMPHDVHPTYEGDKRPPADAREVKFYPCLDPSSSSYLARTAYWGSWLLDFIFKAVWPASIGLHYISLTRKIRRTSFSAC